MDHETRARRKKEQRRLAGAVVRSGMPRISANPISTTRRRARWLVR